jgi:dTDP-4-amino-4,6-dideoxygalactose transaminase
MTAHRETAYAEECAGLSLPATEDACDNSIIIPLYVPMSDEEISTVINGIRTCLSI